MNRHPRGLPPALTALRRTLVMGVLNVTPDSFSDCGRFLDPDLAVAHALEMVADGADLVDVGGESTRPGARRVSAEQELARVLPVVRRLVDAGVVVSVDTMRARVAEAALSAGAHLVNDVSGGQADPAMDALVAASGVPYVLMHWRGHSREMYQRADYSDVVREVQAELRAGLVQRVRAGVDPSQVVLDPGLGFAKRAEHNWALLSALPDLVALGRPVLVGASRKSFLGSMLAGARGLSAPVPPAERDAASAAVTALAAAAGAWAVRVHTCRASADAVLVARCWAQGRPENQQGPPEDGPDQGSPERGPDPARTQEG